MPESSDDLINFAISGEVRRSNYLALLQAIGNSGVTFLHEEEVLASPSLLIELVGGDGEPSVPAVTKDSMALCLEANGMHEGYARAQADAIFSVLEGNLLNHRSYRDNVRQSIYDRRVRGDICTCPLEPVITAPSWLGGKFTGIEPLSLVNFSRLSNDSILTVLRGCHSYYGFGKKRLATLRSMADQLTKDLAIQNA